MKKFLISLGAIGALSFLSAADITAVKVSGDVSDFGSAKYQTVYVYPQTTITVQDKEAIAINKDNKAIPVQVAVIYNDKQIGFNLKWKDDTKSIQKSTSNRTFGDGAAIQLAIDYSDGAKLPYIGMGSIGREVIVHLQKATEPLYEPNGHGDIAHQMNRKNVHAFDDELSKREDLKKFDEKVASMAVTKYQRSFISAGFRSMTEIKDGSESFSGSLEYKTAFLGLFGDDKMWSATFVRNLKDDYLDLNSPAFPLAIAVWDGNMKNRDGLKRLSSWITVSLNGDSKKLDMEMGGTGKGDIKNGEKVASENCAACHHFGKYNTAPKFMAPNLSDIGGYATGAYIKESMLKPSAVVVPGYNRNAHPSFEWYTDDGRGGRVSTMPDYTWLDQKQVDDVVSYFKTVKAEKEMEKK